MRDRETSGQGGKEARGQGDRDALTIGDYNRTNRVVETEDQLSLRVDPVALPATSIPSISSLDNSLQHPASVRLTGPDGRPVHDLVASDCVAGMRSRGPGFADVIVTSPPYNLGIRYGAYDDTQPREEYLAWIDDWTQACSEALTPGGSLFLNVGSKPSDPWLAMDVANVVRRHMVLQNTIHWIKSIAVEDRSGLKTSFGHYKPITSERFLNDCHEFVFHFSHAGDVELDRKAVGVPYQDKSNIERWAGKSDLRCRGNTWFIPYETIQSRSRERPHPATFPVRLADWCIRLHGLTRIGLVVDPFLGLGSTGVACAKLGIDFLGFEIDREYFEEARDRIGSALLHLGL